LHSDALTDFAANGTESRAPAVNRAIAIVRALADAAEPLSAKSIATQMGIAQSACQGILQVLEAEEFIFRHPQTLKYSIGVGAASVASHLLAAGVSLRAVQDELDVISSTFNITAVANEIDGEGATVVGLAFGGAMFGARLTIGRHVSAWAGASGRCYAAFSGLGTDELQARFEKLEFERAIGFRRWLAQVRQARADGVARDDGQFVRGFTTVAVPVFEGEAMRRSIVAIFGAEQLTADENAALVLHLQDVGRRLST